MALFRRNQNQIDQVPMEVQEYYQAERRERTGMAWLLAIATLAATVALAAALFFGGKWLYSTVANRNNKTAPQTTAQNGNSTQGSGSTGTSSTSTDTPSADKPAGTTNAGTPSAADESTDNSQDANNEEGTASAGQNQSSSAAAGSGNAGALVNTGPANTVAVFIAVSTLGAIAHGLYSRSVNARR